MSVKILQKSFDALKASGRTRDEIINKLQITEHKYYALLGNKMSLYVIRQDGTDLYKIGHSNNIYRRLAAINTHNSNGISVHSSFECEFAPKLEKYLHRLLGYRHVKGEWFKLDYSHLKRIEAVVEYFCSETAPKKNPYEKLDNAIKHARSIIKQGRYGQPGLDKILFDLD